MNILSATNALKEIKLNELDDEFQIAIMNVVNMAFPDSVHIGGSSTGADIRKVIDNELPVQARVELMQAAVFEERNDIIRFFNNIEKVQEIHTQKVNYDDAIKGSFITAMAILVILIVGFLMSLYVLTEDTRGEVVDSRVASIVTKVVDNLAKPVTPPINEVVIPDKP